MSSDSTPRKRVIRNPKKRNHDRLFGFRISAEALERLRRNAEIDGKNISRYLRDKISEIPECPSHPDLCPHCGESFEGTRQGPCPHCGFGFKE